MRQARESRGTHRCNWDRIAPQPHTCYRQLHAPHHSLCTHCTAKSDTLSSPSLTHALDTPPTPPRAQCHACRPTAALSVATQSSGMNVFVAVRVASASPSSGVAPKRPGRPHEQLLAPDRLPRADGGSGSAARASKGLSSCSSAARLPKVALFGRACSGCVPSTALTRAWRSDVSGDIWRSSVFTPPSTRVDLRAWPPSSSAAPFPAHARLCCWAPPS